MKRIWALLAGALVICAASPVRADTRLTGSYDTMTQEWVGSLEASHVIAGPLSMGASFTARCIEGVPKHGIPSFAPLRQDYETWLQIGLGQLTLRLSDWCNHYLAQSGVPAYEDTWGLRLSASLSW